MREGRGEEMRGEKGELRTHLCEASKKICEERLQHRLQLSLADTQGGSVLDCEHAFDAARGVSVNDAV